MTETEKIILLNQASILTALAQLMDSLKNPIYKHLDLASENTYAYIKSFDEDDNDGSHAKETANSHDAGEIG